MTRAERAKMIPPKTTEDAASGKLESAGIIGETTPMSLQSRRAALAEAAEDAAGAAAAAETAAETTTDAFETAAESTILDAVAVSLLATTRRTTANL